MEKVLLFAIMVTVLFGAMKFAEMKFIEQEMKPLKDVVRDLVMVFGSAIFGGYVFLMNGKYLDEMFAVIMNTKTLNSETTQIFTGSPEF
tara:strand:+ start:16 stop:282 length:267 start_codon:yes stop_codon:yes gene_type:complete